MSKKYGEGYIYRFSFRWVYAKTCVKYPENGQNSNSYPIWILITACFSTPSTQKGNSKNTRGRLSTHKNKQLNFSPVLFKIICWNKYKIPLVIKYNYVCKWQWYCCVLSTAAVIKYPSGRLNSPYHMVGSFCSQWLL